MTPLDLFIYMLAFAGGLLVIGIVVALIIAMIHGTKKGAKDSANTSRIL